MGFSEKSIRRLTRAYTPPERDVLKAVKLRLESLGAVAIRVNSGSRPWTDRKGKKRVMKMNSEDGCSDLLVCFPCSCGSSVFLAVETKRAGGKPTPAQSAFLDRVRGAGGVAIVVESVADLERQLRECGVWEG